MTTTSAEEIQLVYLTRICLALPEATRQDHGQHADFQVRGRKFAYYLVDHHGDGIVAVCCRAAPGVNEILIASDPGRYYMPSYIGPRGWVALRLDLDTIDWTEVAELVTDSYRLAAPKRLAALVDRPPA
jgi:hypothetical protein